VSRPPTPHAVTTGPEHHFFGYYEKSPWDPTGRYMLGMAVPFIDREPLPDDEITVGLIDTRRANAWRPLARTRAWNWQQGCMLQWLPGAADHQIVYNARRGARFLGVVLDVQNGAERTLSRPVYTLSPRGDVAMSLNFSRIARTRPGYGYAGVPDPGRGALAPEDDGVWGVDLATGEGRLVVSIAQVAALRPEPDMCGAEHWFNHAQFNTDGSRFAFLHRWRRPEPPGWRTRLFTAKPDGSDLRLLAEEGMVSHYDWRDPSHILAWARAEGLDRYWLLTDGSYERCVLGEGVLTCDGHCSYSLDRRWVLTDTYPDAEQKRTLILFRPEDGRRVDIGRFYAPPELFEPIRCDLHPRWNRDGKLVCIDSAHESTRQMYVLDVADIVDAVD
jgi:hypothetical protein